jgi:hypothetical protein
VDPGLLRQLVVLAAILLALASLRG